MDAPGVLRAVVRLVRGRCVHCGARAELRRARGMVPACVACTARQLQRHEGWVRESARHRRWWSRLPALTACQRCGDDAFTYLVAARLVLCWHCAATWPMRTYTAAQGKEVRGDIF